VRNSAPHEDVIGEWTYRSTHSLTPARDGGEWSASSSGRFTPMERAPCTHWIGGWVGPRAGLDTVSKRKIPNPRRDSNPDHPSRSQFLYRLSCTGSCLYSKTDMNATSCNLRMVWGNNEAIIWITGVTFLLCFWSKSRYLYGDQKTNMTYSHVAWPLARGLSLPLFYTVPLADKALITIPWWRC
jgi:hypothetical protein